MNERDLWWKIVIVGALMALAFASIWPLNEKLKYGIDLAGGYSLLYEIDDTGLTPAEKSDLSQRVMGVLRERVDPQGVYNLVWRPVGHNRLEIQMPRPSEEVVKARRDFEKHQEYVQSTTLRRTDVLRALARTGEDRKTAIEGLIHGIEARRALFARATTEYDALQVTQSEYDKRAKAIEADNLSREDVLEAVKKPADQQTAAFEAMIRGIPARRELLQAAAKSWSELQAAAATTQPAAGVQTTPEAITAYQAKEREFSQAVAKVLEANVDPNKSSDGVTIDRVVELEMTVDSTIADILATNLDIGRLQLVLDTKKGDPQRSEKVEQLKKEFPSLASDIDAMVDANDALRQRRKGEGRLEDPADLQRLLRGAGVLEFRILPKRDNTNLTEFDRYIEMLQTRGPARMAGENDYQWFEIEDPADFMKLKDVERDFETAKKSQRVVVERHGNRYYVLAKIGDGFSLTHRYGEADWTLKGAHSDVDEVGRPAIAFTLDERGGNKFAELTRRNTGEQLCIFLDDQAISHATINSVIRTRGIISGNFTRQEVLDMVKKLNAGSLPKKLKDPPISIRSIGPSLGEANRAAGLRSAELGGILVMVFMIGYYYYAGGVAVVALAMNLLLTLSMMSILGATVTLPGIAGLVLSVGMAVDANVLINERMREELARGNTMRMAIKLGYERAFRAILDSHVTTIITSVILYWLGSEEIKGFGLTLGIGVLFSLFTAYFVTRFFFEMMSMFSIPMEVARYPIYFALGTGAFGALLYGLGYWLNDEIGRSTSLLIIFGRALLLVIPGVLILQFLLVLARAIHMAFQKGTKPRIPMMKLIGVPKVNWVGLRPVFFAFSIITSGIGLFLFFNLDRQELYDIEFLGGTAAQVDLKVPGSLNQSQISERLEQSGATLGKFGEEIKRAKVSGGNGVFVLDTAGVPASRLEPVIKEVLDRPENRLLSEVDAIRYSDPAATQITLRTRTDANATVEQLQAAVAEFAEKLQRAGESIGRAQVQAVEDVEADRGQGRSFEVVTLESNKELVVGAIMETLQNDLDIQPALSFALLDDTASGGVPYFAIRDEDVRNVNLPLEREEAAQVDLRGWKGGVAIILDNVNPPQRLSVLKERLKAMRLQPGFESHGWRQVELFGLRPVTAGSDQFSRLMVVVADENYPLNDDQGNLSSAWVAELAEPEVALLQAALQRQTSLSQITSFNQQVSGEAQTSAIIAIVLSWLAIILYLWFRFGNIRWGLAAVVALVHDIIIAIGMIALCHYVADTAIGRALLLDKFRVDLALVAALMTVIGYSVNDTIVVFDRIREIRGRQPEITPQILNDAISQTMSRTILTGMTTLFTILVMYIFGGPGIHGFNFAMFIGILTGTYSSFAIAAQFLLKKRLTALATASAR